MARDQPTPADPHEGSEANSSLSSPKLFVHLVIYTSEGETFDNH